MLNDAVDTRPACTSRLREARAPAVKSIRVLGWFSAKWSISARTHLLNCTMIKIYKCISLCFYGWGCIYVFIPAHLSGFKKM